jgi:hypothetical protein
MKIYIQRRMTNKEKFMMLVSKDENNTLEYIKDRIANRAYYRELRDNEFKALDKLNNSFVSKTKKK